MLLGFYVVDTCHMFYGVSMREVMFKQSFQQSGKSRGILELVRKRLGNFSLAGNKKYLKYKILSNIMVEMHVLLKPSPGKSQNFDCGRCMGTLCYYHRHSRV